MHCAGSSCHQCLAHALCEVYRWQMNAQGCLPVIVWLIEVPVGDHVLALSHEVIAPADSHIPQDLIL